jgi:hypothetical protein
MRNTRTLARDWCAIAGISWSDLNGRIRAEREAKQSLIQQKSAGRHTPPATAQDAAVIILAPLVAPLWKDVPAGIRRYGGLRAYKVDKTTNFESRFGDDTYQLLRELFDKRTLLDALNLCLRAFRSDESEIHFLSLKIERSAYQARASLSLGAPSTGEPSSEFIAQFKETEVLREGIQPEPIVESIMMRGFVLTAMADLLRPNLKSTHENGPSASTDEPLPSDETPRACKPATTGSHPEARRERDKSQVGFESYGNSSGGAPLPPTEPPDEARPKRYG